MQKFKSPRSSVGHWLAIEKGSRSIAPQGAKLWPFKEGNRQKKIDAKVPFFVNPSSNVDISGLEEFCKNSKAPDHQLGIG